MFAHLRIPLLLAGLTFACLDQVALPAPARAQEASESDLTLREQLIEGLGSIPGLPAAAIDVDVEDGFVRLTGDVPSLPHRRLAGRLSALLPGVEAVNNELKVVPKPISADEDLLIRVRIALLACAPLSDAKLQVEVLPPGEVLLAGYVDRRSQSSIAREVASTVYGVRKVRSKIKVLPPPAVPRIELPPVPISAPLPEPTRRAPESISLLRRYELRIAIRDALKKHPRLDAPGVLVFVESSAPGGVVVIRGSVIDPGVYEAALKFARDLAEVAEVRIDLRVGG